MNVTQWFDWLRDKFSISKLECFAKCPRRAFYKYVKKLKLPSEMSWRALLTGRAIHGGMETDAYAKLRGAPLTVEQVLDAAVAVFEDERKKEQVREADAPVDVFVEEHARQLVIFEKTGERARILPVPGSVEAAFEIHLKPAEGPVAVLEGYTDLVSWKDEREREKTVVDFKSSARAVTDAEVAEHTQLSLEAIGAEATAAKIVNFTAGKRQRPTCRVTKEVPQTQEKTERTLKWVADAIAEFRAALKSGDFPKCSRGAFWCGPRMCEYYAECYPQKVDGIERFVTVELLRPVGALPPATWRQSLAGKIESQKKEDIS